MNRALLLLCSILISLSLVRGIASADDSSSTTGTITGIILDTQGKPANDVIVVAQQAATKMREPITVTTNEKGVFEMKDVPEGEYNLKIRTRDLKAKAAKSVTVTAGKTADVGKVKLKAILFAICNLQFAIEDRPASFNCKSQIANCKSPARLRFSNPRVTPP